MGPSYTVAYTYMYHYSTLTTVQCKRTSHDEVDYIIQKQIYDTERVGVCTVNSVSDLKSVLNDIV